MSEKLSTVVKYQSGSTEQRKLVLINCDKDSKRLEGGQFGAKHTPQSCRESIRNPWLLRFGVSFLAIVAVVTLVALNSKMHAKMENMETKLRRFESLLAAMEEKVNELKDRIRCSVIDSDASDSHGTSCAQYTAEMGQRQFAGPPSTTSSAIGNTNQKGNLGESSMQSTNVNKRTTRAHMHLKSTTRGTSAVYVAWGVTKCPVINDTLVYSGTVASSNKSAFLCLSRRWFEYMHYKDISNTGRAQLHPVVYGDSMELLFEPKWYTAHNYAKTGSEVPCAVCQHSGRTAVLVQPAATACEPNWLKEYSGYLMTSGNEFICVYEYAESVNVTEVALQDSVSRLQFTQYDYEPASRKRAAVSCVVCLI